MQNQITLNAIAILHLYCTQIASISLQLIRFFTCSGYRFINISDNVCLLRFETNSNLKKYQMGNQMVWEFFSYINLDLSYNHARCYPVD